jgi:tRNA (guanine37-N1)-methyltransferase
MAGRMNFTILTLFPEILEGYFKSSIMAKSIEKGLVSYRLVNIRDYATDRHHKCDDAPFGGGAGMLMLPEPLSLALDSVGVAGARTVFVTPSGRPFDQPLAREFAAETDLVIVCGRYEGIDQRVIDRYVDDEVSVGDYVLSSGEVAALAVVDATYRLLEGVINGESLVSESFEDGLLEYPQYTRPEVFRDAKVPEILLSGHHENIRKWRLRERLKKTLKVRPDLMEGLELNDEARKLLKDIVSEGGYHGFYTDGGSVPEKS